jgi:hypothetical protein
MAFSHDQDSQQKRNHPIHKSVGVRRRMTFGDEDWQAWFDSELEKQLNND